MHPAQRDPNEEYVREPKRVDPTPWPARLGRTASALLFLGYPWVLLAGVMALGNRSGSLMSSCTSSLFGGFTCVSVGYPLVFASFTIASRVVLRFGQRALGVLLAWVPFVLVLGLAWASGLIETLLKR